MSSPGYLEITAQIQLEKNTTNLFIIMFCGHCGHRLTSLVYHEKYIRRDGSVCDRSQLKYLCYHKSWVCVSATGRVRMSLSVWIMR